MMSPIMSPERSGISSPIQQIERSSSDTNTVHNEEMRPITLRGEIWTILNFGWPVTVRMSSPQSTLISVYTQSFHA